MAEISTGVITFKDVGLNFSTMRFKVNATRTKAQLTTLADVIDDYSACDRRAVGVVDKTLQDATGSGNRDRKGIVTVQDAFGDTHRYEIPGYNGASGQDQDGEKMEDPDLAAIVAAIAAYTGESYTVLRSPIIQTL